jgi:hypothetical protein
MKRHWFPVVAAVVVWSALSSGASAGTGLAGSGQTAASAGGWGTAAAVPGLAALNVGNDAQVSLVSCVSAGNCGAAGFYSTHTSDQAFVVSQTNGTWGKAEQVPGIAALDGGQESEINSLWCASAGNCSAGGSYTDRFGMGDAFVVDEISGTWGKVQAVPGIAALNKGPDASVDSLSCASAGNCSAGGSYTDGSGNAQAFVVSETGGTWGNAQEVPGAGALNAGGQANINSVSCPSAGNCGATGNYQDTAGHTQVFVVDEKNGTWGNAQEVPGTAALNVGADANDGMQVSCPSAGNCGGGGLYFDAADRVQAFVVNEVNGTWGTAQEVPGSAALNKGGQAIVNSISCASAGNCSAGGQYKATPTEVSGLRAFVVNEVNGTWGTAQKVPGMAALNGNKQATLFAVSCGAAGNCSAGGSYRDAAGKGQAFVVNETKGTWGKALEVPGSAALNVGGGANISSVSCAPAGHCSATGDYTNKSGQQGMVVTKT